MSASPASSPEKVKTSAAKLATVERPDRLLHIITPPPPQSHAGTQDTPRTRSGSLHPHPQAHAEGQLISTPSVGNGSFTHNPPGSPGMLSASHCSLNTPHMNFSVRGQSSGFNNNSSIHSNSNTPSRSHQYPVIPPSPLSFSMPPPTDPDEPPVNTKGEVIEKGSLRKSKLVLVLLVGLKLLTSYDGGAFSVVLGADDGIAAELGLSTAESGTLSSTVFLGNLVGCIIAGNMFSKYRAKYVLIAGMFAHALFTFLFGFSYSFEYAVATRFCIGITLAFPVVYSPIWVEAFGPQDRATTWMALCNAGVPIGIMLGFVIGGLVPAHTDLDWRWIFFSKGIGMVPLLFVMHRMDSKSIDVEGAISESKTGEGPPTIKQSIWRLLQIMLLFVKNKLYICNVAALCALYFVITALQTFITPYLRAPPFNASMNTIVMGFGGTVVTAPVVGVIGGGVLIDKLGGYHEHMPQALAVQALWGAAAGILSVITLMTTDVLGFLLSVWLLLAVGGAIVPVATGVLMASVEEEYRPAASSVSAMCFNLFGYFAGPLFCGFVSDYSGSLTWGIRATLLCSFLGCFPMTYAAYVARKMKYASHSSDSETEERSENEDMSEGPPRIGMHTPPPSGCAGQMPRIRSLSHVDDSSSSPHLHPPVENQHSRRHQTPPLNFSIDIPGPGVELGREHGSTTPANHIVDSLNSMSGMHALPPRDRDSPQSQHHQHHEHQI